VRDIPGGHYSLFDPEHIASLAEALRLDLPGPLHEATA